MEQATIHWAIFIINPSLKFLFTVQCGFILHYNNDSKASISLKDCESIEDASDKILTYCKEYNFAFHKKFTILYPIYQDAIDTEYETDMDTIAKNIEGEAKNRNWKFARIGGLTGKSEDHFFVEKKTKVVKKIIPPLTQDLVFETAEHNRGTDGELLSTYYKVTVVHIVDGDVTMEHQVVYSDGSHVKATWKGGIVKNEKDDCVKISLSEPYKLSVYLNTEQLNFYSESIE